MSDKDLAILLDREAVALAADGNEPAAALVRAAAERINRLVSLYPMKQEA